MQRAAVELHAALAAHPGIQIDTLAIAPAWRWTGPATALFLSRLVSSLPARARRADVVLFTSLVTASVAPAVKRRALGVRFATVANGQDVTLPVAPYQRWLRRVFSSLDGVLSVSRATAAECLSRGTRPERVHVQPLGVDVARFAGGPDRASARAWLAERVGAPSDAFFVVALGRQVPRKGTAWFVANVMPLLPPHAQLVVAGDGPDMPAIRAACQTARVAARVHLLGRVPEDDLQRVLRGGDLFVMPNVPVPGDMEGLGLVAFEAGLSGLPVLAADMEGMRDTITEGANGHLLPPLDPAAFAEAIRRYAADPEALVAASALARAHVTKTFAWPTIAERYVAVLESLGEPVATKPTIFVGG